MQQTYNYLFGCPRRARRQPSTRVLVTRASDTPRYERQWLSPVRFATRMGCSSVTPFLAVETSADCGLSSGSSQELGILDNFECHGPEAARDVFGSERRSGSVRGPEALRLHTPGSPASTATT